MTKIYCGDVSCEFNNNKGICTRKSINLSWNSIVTLLNGRQEYHRCKSYQKSQDSIKIEEYLKKIEPFMFEWNENRKDPT